MRHLSSFRPLFSVGVEGQHVLAASEGRTIKDLQCSASGKKRAISEVGVATAEEVDGALALLPEPAKNSTLPLGRVTVCTPSTSDR
jgi:hypothetical protein